MPGVPGYQKPDHKPPKWLLVAVAVTAVIVLLALAGFLPGAGL